MPALAATTQVQIVRYANDNVTILSETNVTYQWMMSNLPVLGDATDTMVLANALSRMRVET